MFCILCHVEMTDHFSHDTGGGSADPDDCYAYNVSSCPECLAICKEDVWAHKGQTWICANGAILYLPKQALEDDDFPRFYLRQGSSLPKKD